MIPLVSVVVVSYQTAQLTVDCLRSLRAACRAGPYEIIVVDNASTDGSAEAVAASVPGARVVRLARNIGFGQAVNVAAEAASGRWLLLVNPDTTVVGDVVAAFAQAALVDPGAGIYTGRTLRPDGTDDGHSCLAPPTLWSLFCFAAGLSTLFRRSATLNPEPLPRLDRTRPARVPAASGCLLMVERELFRRLGGFAPDYFMYSEDIDLCVRATRLGARPLLVPAATVTHLGGASSTSVDKRVMLLRGKCTYLRLRWPRRKAAIGRALLAGGVGLRALGSQLTGRAGYWRQVWTRRPAWLAGWPPGSPLPAADGSRPGRREPADAERSPRPGA
jgi:hypothetical protein